MAAIVNGDGVDGVVVLTGEARSMSCVPCGTLIGTTLADQPHRAGQKHFFHPINAYDNKNIPTQYADDRRLLHFAILIISIPSSSEFLTSSTLRKPKQSSVQRVDKI